MTYETKHKQLKVSITDPNGSPFTFEVDELLQPVIQLLWDCEYLTFNSCQSNTNGCIWIEIDQGSWEDLLGESWSKDKKLVTFVEEYCELKSLFTDDGRLTEDDYWIEGPHLDFSVSMRFPPEHLDEFTELIRDLLVVPSEEAAV